jgi:hypothetical protein
MASGYGSIVTQKASGQGSPFGFEATQAADAGVRPFIVFRSLLLKKERS